MLLGFAFAVLWDISKNNRAKSTQDKAVIFTLHKALISLNAQIDHNNTLLLPQSENAFMDVPIVSMSLKEAWHLVAYNTPKCIVKDSQLIEHLLNITNQCEMFNVHIAAREQFRVGQKALGGYVKTLKMYENEISKILESIKILVEKANAKIEVLV